MDATAEIGEMKMALTLYYHPLSSFCHKALIALYENDTPFTAKLVNLGDPEDADAFRKIWPLGKFPVLTDDDRVVPESSIIIEYLAQHYPGKTAFIPSDPDIARQMRMRDRFYDLHIHMQMQKIVGDRIRPADKKDPFGVDHARAQIQTSYAMIEQDMASKTWAMGDDFTMADCAAAPALEYANMVEPFAAYKNIAAYYARLEQRPSFARVLKEAEPYRHMFPK